MQHVMVSSTIKEQIDSKCYSLVQGYTEGFISVKFDVRP